MNWRIGESVFYYEIQHDILNSLRHLLYKSLLSSNSLSHFFSLTCMQQSGSPDFADGNVSGALTGGSP